MENWYKYDNPDHLPFIWRLKAKWWGIRLPTSETILESGGVACEYSPMDYFSFSFSLGKTQQTLRLTNSQPRAKRKK